MLPQGDPSRSLAWQTFRACAILPQRWPEQSACSGGKQGPFCGLSSVTSGVAALSAAAGRKLAAQREPTAYFESLNIKTTADVVRHLVHTTSISADLLRGPGGVGEVSQAARKAVEDAMSVCKSFLPRVLRDQRSVADILDLLSNALAAAGSPSSREAFTLLRDPLVSFHTGAPSPMRKALQTRFANVADPLP